jgi:hypothetical protein
VDPKIQAQEKRLLKILKFGAAASGSGVKESGVTG